MADQINNMSVGGAGPAKTVTADRGGHRKIGAGHRHASTLAILVLFAATGIAVLRTGPFAAPESPPPTEVVVIGGREAARPGTEGVSPRAPTAESTAAPRMAYHPLIGRIDPLLDTIMATADGDVRTLHDQIAQHEAHERDAAREVALENALSAATGTRPMRIICVNTICEIVGRTGSNRSLENDALGSQLALQNLSLGPVVYNPIQINGRYFFVQYVVSED